MDFVACFTCALSSDITPEAYADARALCRESLTFLSCTGCGMEVFAPTISIREFVDGHAANGRDPESLMFACITCSRRLREAFEHEQGFAITDSAPLKMDWESSVRSEFNKNLPELN